MAKTSKRATKTSPATKTAEHKPTYQPPLSFKPLENQNKLAEGLLRTEEGKYVPFGPSYALNIPNGRLLHFDSEQNRLSEGQIKVSFSEKRGNKYISKGTYLTIDQILGSGGRITDLNGGCFVATAVYGNPDAPQVQALRDFRDEVLMQHPLGRRAVNFYYSGAGQRAADFIRDQVPSAILPIRKGLDFLVQKYSAGKN